MVNITVRSLEAQGWTLKPNTPFQDVESNDDHITRTATYERTFNLSERIIRGVAWFFATAATFGLATIFSDRVYKLLTADKDTRNFIVRMPKLQGAAPVAPPAPALSAQEVRFRRIVGGGVEVSQAEIDEFEQKAAIIIGHRSEQLNRSLCHALNYNQYQDADKIEKLLRYCVMKDHVYMFCEARGNPEIFYSQEEHRERYGDYQRSFGFKFNKYFLEAIGDRWPIGQRSYNQESKHDALERFREAGREPPDFDGSDYSN